MNPCLSDQKFRLKTHYFILWWGHKGLLLTCSLVGPGMGDFSCRHPTYSL